MNQLFGSAVGTLATIAIAVALGSVLRHLLGRQPARWRSWVASLLALSAIAQIAVPVTRALGISDQPSNLPDVGTATAWAAVMALVVVACCAAALGLLVLGEAVLPTGRLGTPLDLIRACRSGFKRWWRYLSLGWIMVSSGLWQVARHGPGSPSFDRALVTTFNRAGPTFVKIGQVLSTRTEVLSPELATALSRLQSDVPALPSGVAEREIEQAWGRPIDQVLGSFDAEPMGAASLAQVHAATLPDATPVVIKVRRPGAVPRVRVDCQILNRFAQSAEQRFTWARRMGVVALASGLSGSLLRELDYRQEAHNASVAAVTMADDSRFVVPTIHHELSTDSVLVMDRLFGRSAEQAAGDLTGEQRAALARALVERVALSIFADGVFHADLHPGNILVLDDGRIGLLDFGAIGVIDTETRRLLATLVMAMLAGDNLGAATALTMAFEVDQSHSTVQLQRDLGRLMTLHLSGATQIDAFIADLFGFFAEYGIAVPGDVAGAFRTLASLQGTIAVLDPDLDYVVVLRQLLPTLVRRVLSPDVVAQQALVESALSLSIGRRLPERVDRITSALADGSLVVRTRALAHTEDRAWAASMVIDAVTGVLAAVLIGVGAWLTTRSQGPVLGDSLPVTGLTGAGLCVVGAVLSFRLLVRLFRR